VKPVVLLFPPLKPAELPPEELLRRPTLRDETRVLKLKGLDRKPDIPEKLAGVPMREYGVREPLVAAESWLRKPNTVDIGVIAPASRGEELGANGEYGVAFALLYERFRRFLLLDSSLNGVSGAAIGDASILDCAGVRVFSKGSLLLSI
jgi:hypothetical protein